MGNPTANVQPIIIWNRKRAIQPRGVIELIFRSVFMRFILPTPVAAPRPEPFHLSQLGKFAAAG